MVEKTWRVPVEPEDPSKFRIPVKKGAPIRFWGIVQVRGGETEKSREEQSAEAEASQVEIKVKGVELR